MLGAAIESALGEVAAMPEPARLDARYGKFRNMGRLGIDFVDDTAVPATDRRPR